ncbi:unnamed protein product, partial [Rotaria magnacalcarata]
PTSIAPKVTHKLPNVNQTVSQLKTPAKDIEPSSVQLSDPATSRPHYRNHELEQIMANNKGSTELNLLSKQLTDRDMEIVVYYVLQNNQSLDLPNRQTAALKQPLPSCHANLFSTISYIDTKNIAPLATCS